MAAYKHFYFRIIPRRSHLFRNYLDESIRKFPKSNNWNKKIRKKYAIQKISSEKEWIRKYRNSRQKKWWEKEDGKKEKGEIDDGKNGKSNLTVTIVFTFENFVVLKAMVMLPTKSSKKW